MKISIANDHRAIKYKEEIVKYLDENGIEVIDYGTNRFESADYPDFAYGALKAVTDGIVDYAILLCGTGIGMSIVANKVRGIRCSLVYLPEVAKITKQHNNPNVLASGVDLVSIDDLKLIVDNFINTSFENEPRHVRRLMKVELIEDEKYGDNFNK